MLAVACLSSIDAFNLRFKVEGDNPDLAERLNISGAVLLPSTFLLVSLYQMVPPILKRNRKEKADRKLAIERGSTEEWKVWKIVRTKYYCRKIYAWDREHWDAIVRQQHETRRKSMTIELNPYFLRFFKLAKKEKKMKSMFFELFKVCTK